MSTVWETCQPWPWLLAGTTPRVPAGLPDLLGSHPIPVHWVGQPPPGLPGHTAVHGDWMQLVAALEPLRQLFERGVRGVRLLRNRGLRSSDGRVVLGVANLEGLLAAPAGLALPPDGGAALQREIDASGLPLRLDRTGERLRLT
ncbi:MAG TPA: hypothetical protein VLW53_15520 [Candidatus Eisenbacteria bacterium]|nr:hypothetical protein [Candidatus Eisenbacteria bacterium]